MLLFAGPHATVFGPLHLRGAITMTLTDKIQASVQKLPTAYQTEVLDFVEYLLAKTTRGSREHEEDRWSDLSLAFAMRGMEDEDSPQYTKADLKVIFS
jgi:uncharacterized protein DUF2281